MVPFVAMIEQISCSMRTTGIWGSMKNYLMGNDSDGHHYFCHGVHEQEGKGIC
jgi:hypothetical protein